MPIETALTNYKSAEWRQQQVDLAATILDRAKPGWERRVNPDTLNLMSLDCCILGQVYSRSNETCESGWGRGMRALFPDRLYDDAFVQAHGFTVEVFAADAHFRNEWINAIAQRLALYQSVDAVDPVGETVTG